MMIQEFYKLGYDMALSEVGLADRPVTKLGWIAPVVGGLAGAVAAPWVLPHLGAEGRAVNPALGALMGAGLGAGGAEVARETLRLMTPRLSQQFRARARSSLKALEDFKARYTAQQAIRSQASSIP